jgi:aspartate/glutamate racemase
MQTKFYLNKKLIKSIKNTLIQNKLEIAYIDNIHDELITYKQLSKSQYNKMLKNIGANNLEIGIQINNTNLNLIINTRSLKYYLFDNNYNYLIQNAYIKWQPNLRQNLPNIIYQIFKPYISQN